jgi:very-short-patch-repair endonuclease
MGMKNIVTEQKVSWEMKKRSKELRKDQTPSEKKLWECLRKNRCGDLHFRRQQVILGTIVDFYCHAASLIIELDGPYHDDQVEKDQARDEWLISQGFTVMRFRNEQIDHQIDKVLEQISATAQSLIAADHSNSI